MYTKNSEIEQQWCQYIKSRAPLFEWVTATLIRDIYVPRASFTHKGNYGHAGLIAGSGNMMGAALLCAKACMRSGVGKLTCHIPAKYYPVMYAFLPESINSPYVADNPFDALGVGPGIGTCLSNKNILEELFRKKERLVIDADSLNIISLFPELLNKIPPFSILTPHPGECDRLFGKSTNDFERIEKVRQKAQALNLVVILKGHFTMIAMPGGKAYFNNTGNPGMATAGSGDVLTGILTGLLSQHYTPEEAALLGVYLHGLAGDIAAEKFSQEAMIASDIIDSLGEAFKSLKATPLNY